MPVKGVVSFRTNPKVKESNSGFSGDEVFRSIAEAFPVWCGIACSPGDARGTRREVLEGNGAFVVVDDNFYLTNDLADILGCSLRRQRHGVPELVKGVR